MAGADMTRKKDLAGKSVKQGQYTVTYDENGYATHAKKDGGASATSTVKTTHANDSADHRAAYDAAAAGDWDKAASYINNIIMQSPSGTDEGGGTVYNAKAGKDYFAELQNEFKYNAKNYYDQQYDKVYGDKSAATWDATNGAIKTYADLVNAVGAEKAQQYVTNQYSAANGGNMPAYQFGTVTNPMEGYTSFEDFLSGMGYDTYTDQTQKYIQAAVQNAIGGYRDQIADVNQDSAELARQAYIAKMLGEKNLDQEMAASGYAGGMADSQRIGLQANYENNLQTLQRERDAAIRELELAIENAKLTGDMQAAQELTSYLQQVQGQWVNYVQNQQALANQNYWNQMNMENQNYWNQQSLNADARNTARNWALTLIEGGSMPDTETLTAAGMSAQEAQTLLNSIKAQNAPRYTGTPTVKYTADQAETALTALINGANDATARSIVEGYYGMPVGTVLQAYGTPAIRNGITLDQLDENQITNGKTANGVMLARTGQAPLFVSWAELGDMMNSGAAYAKEAGNGKYTLAYNG